MIVGVTLGLLSSLGGAVEIAGEWRAEFESPRGPQTYQFTFQTAGDKLTGKAVSKIGERSREAELLEGQISSNAVSFVELLNFQGNEVRIRYTGKIATNGIAFTREVGDFGKVDFTATRVEATATNPPPAASAVIAPTGVASLDTRTRPLKALRP